MSLKYLISLLSLDLEVYAYYCCEKYGFLSPSPVIFLIPKSLLSVLEFCCVFESLHSPGS